MASEGDPGNGPAARPFLQILLLSPIASEPIHHPKMDRFEPLPFVFQLLGFLDDLLCSSVSCFGLSLVDGNVLARRALRLGPHRLRRVEVLAKLLREGKGGSTCGSWIVDEKFPWL